MNIRNVANNQHTRRKKNITRLGERLTLLPMVPTIFSRIAATVSLHVREKERERERESKGERTRGRGRERERERHRESVRDVSLDCTLLTPGVCMGERVNAKEREGESNCFRYIF